jgi:hypothetical protein
MQGRSQANEAKQGLDGYEQMLNAFAEQAETFWKSMGPAGEPMALGIESFAQMQRAYLRWIGQARRTSGMSFNTDNPAVSQTSQTLKCNVTSTGAGSATGGACNL